jgi:hypothetical protein
MNNERTLLLTAAAVVFVLTGGPAAAATHAAKVVYAFGDVRATDATGAARGIRRGDRLASGDTVSTVRGRAQIKFTDGGFASLQPNTDYRIDDYSYEGREDGSERSFFNLVKGSVRFVTGVVGRANRKNFRIKTKVATIGIRGSSGIVTSDERGTFVTGEGLCAAAAGSDVCTGLPDFVTHHCDGAACRRQDIREPDRVEVEPGFEDEENVVQGDEQGELGIPCDVGGCGEQFLIAGDLIGGDAESFGSHELEAFNGLFIVSAADEPIGGVVIWDLNENADPFDSDVVFLTNDPDGVQQALNTFPDPEVVAAGSQIFDAIDPMHLDSMRRNPAALWDLQTSAEGLVTARFAPSDPTSNGHLLEVDVDFGSVLVSSELLDLQRHQSYHFWYGPDPGPIVDFGMGTYTFTGGTPSTAADGSSIGHGVISGELQIYFCCAFGNVNMVVDHNPPGQPLNNLAMVYDVSGGIDFPSNPKFFFDNSVIAMPRGGMPAYIPVWMHGAVAVPNSGSAPGGAGLSYDIDPQGMYITPIQGVAVFGLQSFDPNAGF